ncbi:hypothetical protein COS91_02065 [Candidatus Desantisbacteria bacterium CG07_land_8_20_14_0_80_39_15]|uniref:ATPase n=1 Tax=Candidatus Desantisbacteria bacterium CG07_land_8_20_14_0_80_39_15 TaxID=1974549 RepID=A0A2M6ZHM8_9BACT|nr:MAG: hypothetical protein COS91_02065 [Candidatus Desantisbacteria bacterium CG07_land_8_20_14_0_80_39_15]
MVKELFYEFWEKTLPEVRTRELDIGRLDTDLINDIVGIRRCGKTYFMFLFIKHLLDDENVNKNQILYLNFENRKLHPLKESYFNDIVDFVYAEKLLDRFKKIYLFLDEAQNINGWEKQLRSIYDEFKGKVKIVISGSNASLLKKDYAALLTGRHLTINLYPLSFKEFLNFNNFSVNNKKIFTEREKSLIRKYLTEYIKSGGFPEVVLADEYKEDILQQYFGDIITRDIISRERIRKDAFLVEEIAAYLINNISNLFSLRKISNFFGSSGNKISVPTLQNYLRFFENAFLFIPIRIFSYKIRERLQHPQKIYCIDAGLISALSSKSSPDWGRLYENTVAVELKRKKCEIYYWKDYRYNEVDFVIKKGLKISTLIQVCYDMNKDNYEREASSLIKCSKELKCKDLLIITDDEEREFKESGITIKSIPLYKFLLFGY